MLYNYEFVTTYSFYNKSLYLNNPISCRYSYEKDKTPEEQHEDDDTETTESELDENFTSKYLYDNELLHAFNMENYDANILSDRIFELYTHLNSLKDTYPDIQKLLQIANDISMKYIYKNDIFNGFMILFSFDYFHITHLCICDILNEDSFGTISKNNYDFLMKNINS